MEILIVIGAAVFAVGLAFIFKELQKEYAVMITAAGGIIIVLWALPKIFPFIEYMRELTEYGNISEYFGIILKVLAVSFLVQVGADICRDFGENSMASRIEFAGKAVILAAVLPLLRTVINMSMDLLA